MLNFFLVASLAVSVTLFWPAHNLHNAVEDGLASLRSIDSYPTEWAAALNATECPTTPQAQQCCNATQLVFKHLEPGDSTPDNIYYLTTVLAAVALIGIPMPQQLQVVVCLALFVLSVLSVVAVAMAYDTSTEMCDDMRAELASAKLGHPFDVNWVGEHPMLSPSIAWTTCRSLVPAFSLPVFQPGYLAPDAAALLSVCDAGEPLLLSYLIGLVVVAILSILGPVLHWLRPRPADSAYFTSQNNPIFVGLTANY